MRDLLEGKVFVGVHVELIGNSAEYKWRLIIPLTRSILHIVQFSHELRFIMIRVVSVVLALFKALIWQPL